MSHQPSTRDQLHDRAARIYDRAIAPQDQDADQDSENFTRDPLGNVVRKGALKDRLGEATVPERGGEEGILEKVCSYIPGLDKSQQQNNSERCETEKREWKEEERIKRPENDVQVEAFLREQYNSRSAEGMPNPDRK
ncbi:hypothetical protein M430DRAFT_56067 [Amorphotheca resinae ATCC 22711]|uniref:Uncharacterized protein n=1 Tax=Amorphotheca resinae ATCC 22711 TaxID=857342 RepID=A0A2T3BAJ0_AMORE|nr:hypothetical protein M430DRAFT_56067 [Amorphotheca resinae ATCC 22711]PSS25284.1 hypothetical protein M430DRAFT_56067 [Amorphotheca resinae ATCC 22711]